MGLYIGNEMVCSVDLSYLKYERISKAPAQYNDRESCPRERLWLFIFLLDRKTH
jgi:hypothetical protein